MLYLFRKIASGSMILLGVILLVFTLFMLLPSPEEIVAGQRSDESTRAAMRAEMGLDRSRTEQLLLYLKDLSPVLIGHNLNPAYTGLRWKAGKQTELMIKWPWLRTSYQSRRPVSDILAEAFTGSLVLSIAAMGIALFLGIGSGILSALSPGSVTDRVLVGLATLGISLPSFFLAVLIAWLFGYLLSETTGLTMTGSLFRTDPVSGENVLALRHLILPSVALGVRPYSIILQLTRSSLIDVLSQDYIRTARAKGLSKFQVIRKHALRNALNPVVTAASGWFASLLAGAFFVEYIFSWKGLGKVTIEALQQSDLPVVMGAVLLISFIFICMNVLVDVLYARLDPRVKLS